MNSPHKHSQVRHTNGGLAGHILRRSIHVCVFLLPLLYYAHAKQVANHLSITPSCLLIGILLLTVVLDLLRIKMGWTFFGQRVFESGRPSSFAWGLISVCLVLLLAPSKVFAIPIIWSCAFVDPVVGELRRVRINPLLVYIIGAVEVIVIWVCLWSWLGTPLYLAFLMAPITVALEWPKLRWIDDNALMQIIPLLIIICIYGVG